MKKIIFILIFYILISESEAQIILSQEEMRNYPAGKEKQSATYTVENGDTIYNIVYNPIAIYPKRKFKNKKEEIRYTKMIMNVKKVYPYSILISETVNEINTELSKLKTEKQKRTYLDDKEKELTENFEHVIREMTFTQGRILIKLVDRQTGQTTYEVIKQFKGGFSAVFWQSIARLFSTDLKYEYDSKGDDQWIEEIVAKIENGEL